ncbi:uncharacterized protein LOC126316988 [Schistocerca gregaria]|uniref:uncharacterized protein LOC126316988 n=1 Tax=Schistocerca gregaria TaxID=7010 RepID=UPI00211E07E9|nr:uncharacterized protein LOC126316988 [Schistocerca gregaria]
MNEVLEPVRCWRPDGPRGERVHLGVKSYRTVVEDPVFSGPDYAFVLLMLCLGLACYELFRSLASLQVSAALVVIRVILRMSDLKEESISIFQDLGIEVRKVTFGGGEQILFVERSKIKSVVINEAVTCSSVFPYIAVIVYEEEEMVAVFDSVHVEYKVISKIYNDILRCRRAERRSRFSRRPSGIRRAKSVG